MSFYRRSFRHFVPAEKRKEDYPFTYSITELGKDHTETIHAKGVFEVGSGELKHTITNTLITVFDFYKYLDEKSVYNVNTNIESKPVYNIEIDIIQEVMVEQIDKKTGAVKMYESEPNGELKPVVKKEKKVTQTFVLQCTDFKSDYSFTLIRDIDHLKEVLTNAKKMTLDVETSGLDPEFDVIAGVNFAVGPKKGYYMPLAHNEEFKQYNLPREALDLYYEATTKADVVYLFNSRFDLRFMEYYEYDLDETKSNIINKRYDMSKINFLDAQLMMYFADPDWKQHNMAWAEKHFLGYYRPDLSETLKLYNLQTFDTTKIDPTKLLYYAAQDGITTYELGEVTYPYQVEFGLAGQLDSAIIYPLMEMENRLIKLDMDYLEEQYKVIATKLAKLEKDIAASIGYEINLNSPKQKVELFKSFNLDTQEKTKTGNMSTSTPAVKAMIERMDAAGESYPKFVALLGEQATYKQLESTFFGSLNQQAGHRNGRGRLNYRHGNTATGRFSSGKEV